MTFLDKKSRYLYIKLMRSKEETLNMFKTYKNLSENQTNTTIKELFTDNSTKYTNKQFNIYIK